MKKIIIAICMVVMSLVGTAFVPSGDTWALSEEACANNPKWRDDKDCSKYCVETSLMGTQGSAARLSCDTDQKGGLIRSKLLVVIDIISIVIGALGVAAITYVGIIYLTAGADVAKAVKARTRLIEIIIGLAIYAMLYTILNFLIPNFEG